jgi:glycogen(starch) synthase
MRILHCIYDDVGNPWVGGGGAARSLEIYKRIAVRGHRVDVACGNYPGAAPIEVRQGVVYRHTGLPYSYIASRLTYMLGAARLIKRRGYDIVIEDVSPYSPVGAPLWNSRVPMLASVQNLSGTHAPEKYGLPGWGPRLAEKPLLGLFHTFVAVSPGIAEQLRSMLGQDIDIAVIPNSAGQISPSSTKNADSPNPYILSLGRIDIHQKGLDRLIEAFDQVADSLPAVRLVIAGGGSDSQVQALESLVREVHHRDRIEVLGQVDRRRADELLRSATLVVMPSRYEAWPLVAIEAGAAGVPVVGTDVVGVRDAAPPYPEGHGYLVRDGEVAALAEAIVKLEGDRELRQKVGERGRAWAARFSWDELATKQLAFYEQVVRQWSVHH